MAMETDRGGAVLRRNGAAFGGLMNSITRRARSQRPIFGPYRYAFYLLFAVCFVEWLIAAYLGTRFLNMTLWQVTRIADIRMSLPAWLLIPLVWIGLATYKIVRRRIDRPSATLLRLIRFRSPWLLRGMVLFGCYFPMARAYGVIKSSIPDLQTYYLDPFLVKLDVWMLGTDAWRITHGLFPKWFVFAIDRVYILWFTYSVLIAGWICFSRDPRFQIRGALSLNLCWIMLGTVTAILTASVGPCFYALYFGSQHFAELMEIINAAHEDRGLVARYAMDFLVRKAGTGTFGAGISAMPSMHVAMSYLGFVAALTSARSILLKVVTGLFTLATIVGSVHLGWHYLSDGLVSIAGVTLIWWGCGKLVEAIERQGTRPRGAPREH